MSSRALANRLPFGKKLTPAQVDVVLHAPILVVSFVALALTAAFGGGF